MSYLGLRPAVVLGEALCDLLCDGPGVALVDSEAFHPRIGGAPANLAVQISRLGVPTFLITAVGDEPLSDRILAALRQEGVHTDAIAVRELGHLGLTFIAIDASGERAFFPWREGAADQTLRPDEVDGALIEGARCLCHGTVSLRRDPVRGATRRAVAYARAAKVPVVLDVNLRLKMFDRRRELFELAQESVRHADVVKATREEAELLYDMGGASDDDLLDRLLGEGPSLALLTFGPQGAAVASTQGRVRQGPASAAVVDATGAGDAFLGAAVATLFSGEERPTLDLDDAALASLLAFACRAGAAACEALGATAGMLRADVEAPPRITSAT